MRWNASNPHPKPSINAWFHLLVQRYFFVCLCLWLTHGGCCKCGWMGEGVRYLLTTEKCGLFGLGLLFVLNGYSEDPIMRICIWRQMSSNHLCNLRSVVRIWLLVIRKSCFKNLVSIFRNDIGARMQIVISFDTTLTTRTSKIFVVSREREERADLATVRSFRSQNRICSMSKVTYCFETILHHGICSVLVCYQQQRHPFLY